MIEVFDNVDATGKPNPKRIGSFPALTLVHLQVLGPNVLRIARTAAELLTDGMLGAQNGIQITAATHAGVFSVWWIGDMWGIGSAPSTQADIQVMA